MNADIDEREQTSGSNSYEKPNRTTILRLFLFRSKTEEPLLPHSSNAILTDADLAEIADIVEFFAIVVVAWLISESVLDSLLKVNALPTYAVLGKWIAFFLTLLIYYKLIRFYVRVKKEL